MNPKDLEIDWRDIDSAACEILRRGETLRIVGDDCAWLDLEIVANVLVIAAMAPTGDDMPDMIDAAYDLGRGLDCVIGFRPSPQWRL